MVHQLTEVHQSGVREVKQFLLLSQHVDEVQQQLYSENQQPANITEQQG